MELLVTKPDKTIVGITGVAGSGKSTIANLFENHGFIHVSTGDLVREELVNEGALISRFNQTRIANDRRSKYGGGYWVKKALTLIDDAELVVLSGLYSPAEGDYVHQLSGSLVHVNRPINIAETYRVILERSDGARDNISPEEFSESLRRETGGEKRHETNIDELDPFSPDYLSFLIEAHHELLKPSNKHRNSLFRFHIIMEEYLANYVNGDIDKTRFINIPIDRLDQIDLRGVTIPPTRIQWMFRNFGFTATREGIV